jgi:outer membrane protein insertion porin family
MPASARLAQTLRVVFAAPIAALLAQAPISELRVEGCARYRPEVVISASGLCLHEVVGRQELEAAARKLVDSGFFQSANYRYQPRAASGKSTYAVTLEVAEEPATLSVVVDIPDIDATTIWKELNAAHSLAGERLPDNERATSYCRLAIESVLRRLGHPQEIAAMHETDLPTRRMEVVFRSANAPKIAGFQFTGRRAVESAALTTIVERLLKGREYSEREVRRVLKFNIQPLYEERGMLTVTFPRVRTVNPQGGTVDVAVHIDEGPVWTLGKVDIVGDGLPLDDLRAAARFGERSSADWKKLMAAVAAMEQPLWRDGYIHVHSNPVRSFRKEELIVDVTVEVTKGLQFVLGILQLSGLGAADQVQAARLCKLRAGDPLNGPYLDEYAKAVIEVVTHRPKYVSRELRVRVGTNVVDVSLSYR